MKTNSKSVPYMIIAANYKAFPGHLCKEIAKMLKRDFACKGARENISRQACFVVKRYSHA